MSKRLLNTLCTTLNMPYKYIHSIATKEDPPSSNVQRGLSKVIYPSYWYEEADTKFCKYFTSQSSLEKPLSFSSFFKKYYVFVKKKP